MIPDEAVEAAAKAVYGGDHLDGSPQREAWLRDFRIALEAAAPHMLGGAWRAGYLALADDTVRDRELRMRGGELTARTPNPYRSQA